MAISFSKASVIAVGSFDVLSDALVASRLVSVKFIGPLQTTQSDLTDRYQALWNSRVKLFRSWVLVPSGILVILVACFGVDTFFKHFGVSFPASVACMLLLFAGLWISDLVIGSHRTRQAVAAIDVSVSCWV